MNQVLKLASRQMYGIYGLTNQDKDKGLMVNTIKYILKVFKDFFENLYNTT